MAYFPNSWFKAGKIPSDVKLCFVSYDTDAASSKAGPSTAAAALGYVGVLGLGGGVQALHKDVRVTYSRPYLMVAKLLRARGFTKVWGPHASS